MDTNELDILHFDRYYTGIRIFNYGKGKANNETVLLSVSQGF